MCRACPAALEEPRREKEKQASSVMKKRSAGSHTGHVIFSLLPPDRLSEQLTARHRTPDALAAPYAHVTSSAEKPCSFPQRTLSVEEQSTLAKLSPPSGVGNHTDSLVKNRAGA